MPAIRVGVTTDRPIARDWTCQRSGDCCRSLPAVVMTRQEVDAILAHPAAAGRSLRWSKEPASNFWALAAAPCPLLDGNACSVYTARPYNCRRFGCFRPDPRSEPLELEDGACRNFLDRFGASRAVRRAAAALQRKAQRWAVAHGWRP